jgi:segregation and condensation protein B
MQMSSAPAAEPPVEVGGPLVRDEKLVRLESVLFLAKQPLHARKLSKYANLADGTEGLTLIRRLNTLYDKTGRAFRVEEVANGWQLRTRRKFANWLRRLPHVPAELRLSPPSMETLAVVAYRQPVVRAEVETVRGVACGEILRQLMEKDLIRVAGRSEELGRPYLYSTTNKFLQVFGLRGIEELPRAAIFQEAMKSVVADRDKETAVSMTHSSNAGEVPVAECDDLLETAPAATAVVPPLPTISADDEEWEDEEYEFDDDDEEEDDDDLADDDLDEDDEFDDDDDEDEDELDDDDVWEDDDDDDWEEVEDETIDDDEDELEDDADDWDDEEVDDDEWEDDDDEWE